MTAIASVVDVNQMVNLQVDSQNTLLIFLIIFFAISAAVLIFFGYDKSSDAPSAMGFISLAAAVASLMLLLTFNQAQDNTNNHIDENRVTNPKVKTSLISK